MRSRHTWSCGLFYQMTQRLLYNPNSVNLWIFFFFPTFIILKRLPRWCNGKECTCQCRRRRTHRFDPWVRKIPWRRKWQLILVHLPEKLHGQRSLVGYSPWGHRVRHNWVTEHAHNINKPLTPLNLNIASIPDKETAWSFFRQTWSYRLFYQMMQRFLNNPNLVYFWIFFLHIVLNTI